jgi:acetyl esterase/lipase
MTAPFDPVLFRPDSIDADTAELNRQMIALMSGLPEWWVVGAEATRAARRRGEGPFPAPIKSPRARVIIIPGKDGTPIPLRIIAPDNPRGIYLHIHGGGWVLGSAELQDPMLERIADNTGQAVVSVEYRLAPDLSAVTILRMRDRYGYTGFRGANLVYGAYDLSMTPSQRAFGDTRLVLRTIDMQQFYHAFLPTVTDRRLPDISPLYADLKGLCPALFSVGTRDALLDDTLFMHARWVAAGNPAELAIYPGGAHGFTLFPNRLSQEASARMDDFLRRVIA